MAKTTEVLEQMLNDHKEYLTLQFSTVNTRLDGLTSRVEKTNGRVKRLEIWKATILGAWAVITILFLPVFAEYLKEKFLPDNSSSYTLVK